MSIYGASGSNPGTRIGSSLTGTIDSDAGQTTYTASGITLNGATTYFVHVCKSGTGQRHIDSTSSNTQTGSTGWTIADEHLWTNDGTTWSTLSGNYSFKMTLNATAALTTTLTATSITPNSATLTLTNNSAAWYYKSTVSGSTCSASQASTVTMVSLTSLSTNTSYTYKAYSDSGCATAIASVTFKTQLLIDNSLNPPRKTNGLWRVRYGTNAAVDRVGSPRPDYMGPLSYTVQEGGKLWGRAMTNRLELGLCDGGATVEFGWYKSTAMTVRVGRAWSVQSTILGGPGTLPNNPASIPMPGPTDHYMEVPNAEAGTYMALARCKKGNVYSGAIHLMRDGHGHVIINPAGGVGRGNPQEELTVALSVSPNPVDEGSPVTVTATLSSPAPQQMVFPVTISPGTTGDGDIGTLGSITIAAGESSGAGQITTASDDGNVSHDEFIVGLDTSRLPSGVTAGQTTSVTVTITDSSAPQRQQGPQRAPDPVTNIAVTHNGSSLMVTWDAPERATHYDVTYSGNGANARGAWNRAGTSLRITCDVRTGYEGQHCISGSSIYTVAVRARNGVGESGWTNSAPSQPPSPPSPVRNIVVTHNGDRLTVTWDGPAEATHYDVTYYRQDTKVNARAAWNREGTSLTITCDVREDYKDQNCIDSGATYTVGVRARNGVGSSPWRESDPAVLLPPAQATIWLTTPGPGQIELLVVRPARTVGYEVQDEDGQAAATAAAARGARRRQRPTPTWRNTRPTASR